MGLVKSGYLNVRITSLRPLDRRRKRRVTSGIGTDRRRRPELVIIRDAELQGYVSRRMNSREFMSVSPVASVPRDWKGFSAPRQDCTPFGMRMIPWVACRTPVI